jgi:hypothetical protein
MYEPPTVKPRRTTGKHGDRQIAFLAIGTRPAKFPHMDISAATAAPQASKYNPPPSSSKVDYNPPPTKEGLTPSLEAIAAEAAAADPRGRNLDIFA